MSESATNNAVSLMNCLTDAHIAVKVRANGWEDAVEKVGKLLARNGLIDESYTEAMKRTVRELGPYCVIAPGIAMPHARPQDGVWQTGFALITLDEAVEFGNKDNDPVDIVIGFAAVNKTSHILALKEIATYLGDEAFVQRIRSSRTKSELINLISTQRK
jgi:mannitol/fructose-specific phosphotransferase system IIA component (Ntr-type)